MGLHQYHVVGRRAPTSSDDHPQIYRMRIFAPNEVVAKSRFWYFMRQTAKMKRASGEILSVNEIRERNSRTVKNFGLTLKYFSRTGIHNMYKEFRDLTLCGAVEQMYQEMAGRHRVRWSSVVIIDTKEVAAGVRANKRASEGDNVEAVMRPHMKQFLSSKLKFPLAHRLQRPSSKGVKTTFKANRPTTFFK